MTPEPKETSVLSQARDIAFVLAIFLFFLGFSYERYLLSLLGIAVLPEINLVYFLTFAFDAMRFAPVWLSIWYAAVLTVLIVLELHLSTLKEIAGISGRNAARAVGAFLVIAAFPALYNYAREASSQAREDIVAGRGIPVAISKADSVPAALQRDNAQCAAEFAHGGVPKKCRLRLVYETNDFAYVCDTGQGHALGQSFEVEKKSGAAIIRISRP